MTVVLPGLDKSSQTLKIRLLPGKPAAVKLVSFNDGFNKIEGENGKLIDEETCVSMSRERLINVLVQR